MDWTFIPLRLLWSWVVNRPHMRFPEKRTCSIGLSRVYVFVVETEHNIQLLSLRDFVWWFIETYNNVFHTTQHFVDSFKKGKISIRNQITNLCSVVQGLDPWAILLSENIVRNISLSSSANLKDLCAQSDWFKSPQNGKQIVIIFKDNFTLWYEDKFLLDLVILFTSSVRTLSVWALKKIALKNIYFNIR